MKQRVTSLSGLVLLCTHRPQVVIIVGIYCPQIFIIYY